MTEADTTDVWVREAREAVAGFDKLDLTALPAEVLMERLDRKFPLPISQLAEVVRGLDANYFVISAAGDTVSPYETVYFDTPDLRFYHNHHRGKKNRMKIRYRGYPNTDTWFLEVKRKNNKARTAKQRIGVDRIEFPFSAEALGFLRVHAPEVEVETLRPVATIRYDRLAFIAKNRDERFSIDFNLRFESDGRNGNFGPVAVAEVKQAHYRTTPAVRRFRQAGLRESGLSKYCLALADMNPGLKSALFKSNFRTLKKTIHA